MLIRRVWMLVMAAALGACTLGNKPVPALTGPSELALSLAVAASPDHISQDGQSLSIITVTARDASGQLMKPPLSLHADLFVNGIQADFGTLSSRDLSIGSDGRASIAYLAPAPPPATAGDDNVVTIFVSPVGTDFGSTVARRVNILLMRPGVILPPNGTPIPSFFFSPQQPHENDVVQFDASGSSDDGQIVSYTWSFGDGSSGSGVKVSHTYPVAGSYNVTLTVKDDRGLSASTSPTSVGVVAAPDPTATFTLSPPTNAVIETPVFMNASGSTVPPGRTIVSYDWDFGDGTTGSGQTVSHTYHQLRTFTIVLTVTDSTGRKNSVPFSKTITVGP